jgi:lysyl-tRNA synthetase, class I
VLPISAKTGIVLQVPVEVVDADAGLIRFDDGGDMVTQSALGGQAKLQWKVDWAMRWVALSVDYEMYGKDLIDSGQQSGKIARILGGRPPEGFVYEMFLDELGQKISKSKGNGLTLEQWLDYGTQESLSFFAYREPKKAKALHIGVIPRAVDEYFQFRGNYAAQPIEQKLGNPVHHIHDGAVPADLPPVTYGLLLNLVGIAGVGTAETVWGYLSNYAPGLTPDNSPELDHMVKLAVNYGCDFVAPTLKRRRPVGVEIAALERLDRELAALPEGADGVAIQDIVYAIGNEGGFEKLRDWFGALYETLLGSAQGPRMGSFIALYGIENTRKLIAEALR